MGNLRFTGRLSSCKRTALHEGNSPRALGGGVADLGRGRMPAAGYAVMAKPAMPTTMPAIPPLTLNSNATNQQRN